MTRGRVSKIKSRGQLRSVSRSIPHTPVSRNLKLVLNDNNAHKDIRTLESKEDKVLRENDTHEVISTSSINRTDFVQRRTSHHMQLINKSIYEKDKERRLKEIEKKDVDEAKKKIRKVLAGAGIFVPSAKTKGNAQYITPSSSSNTAAAATTTTNTTKYPIVFGTRRRLPKFAKQKFFVSRNKKLILTKPTIQGKPGENVEKYDETAGEIDALNKLAPPVAGGENLAPKNTNTSGFVKKISKNMQLVSTDVYREEQETRLKASARLRETREIINALRAEKKAARIRAKEEKIEKIKQIKLAAREKRRKEAAEKRKLEKLGLLQDDEEEEEEYEEQSKEEPMNIEASEENDENGNGFDSHNDFIHL